MVDYVLAGIILIGVVRGFFKGFLGEFMTLVGWIVCLLLVVGLAEPASRMIPADSLGPGARYLLSFAGLLLVGLIAWSGLQKYLLELVRDRGISTLDSLLGGVLGGALGCVLCILGLMVLRAVLPIEPEWMRDSAIASKLMQFESLVRSLMRGLAEMLT